MKRIVIESLKIYEWYDAPLIAAVSTNEGEYFCCCVRYDFVSEDKNYAMTAISTEEKSLLNSVFENGNPVIDVKEFCTRFKDREFYFTTNEPEAGGVLSLLKKSISYDEVVPFLQFPVIDQLTKEITR
jgi:hypothetical protein